MTLTSTPGLPSIGRPGAVLTVGLCHGQAGKFALRALRAFNLKPVSPATPETPQAHTPLSSQGDTKSPFFFSPWSFPPINLAKACAPSYTLRDIGALTVACQAHLAASARGILVQENIASKWCPSGCASHAHYNLCC